MVGGFNEKWNWMDENGDWIETNERLNTYMDVMEDIIPGDANDANHTGKIYTKTTVFSVITPGFYNPPIEIAVAEYNIIGNTILVSIKKNSIIYMK